MEERLLGRHIIAYSWVHFSQVLSFLELIFLASTGMYWFLQGSQRVDGNDCANVQKFGAAWLGLASSCRDISEFYAPKSPASMGLAGPEPEEMYYNCATYYIAEDLTASSCRQPCINNPDRSSLSSFAQDTGYELAVPLVMFVHARSGTVHRQPNQDLLQ